MPDSMAADAGMERPNDLLWLSGGLLGGAFWMLLLLPLTSARVALQQPGGALERLGAGDEKISKADEISLGRLRMFLAVLSALIVCFSLSMIYSAGILGIDITSGETLLPLGRSWAVTYGLSTWAFIVVLSGWWPAMTTASCLCRDEITETIRKVRAVDLADDGGSTDPQAWVDNVATTVLALREPMDELSDSLGPGLLGLSGAMFGVSLFGFTLAVNVEFCTGFDENTVSNPTTAPHPHHHHAQAT